MAGWKYLHQNQLQYSRQAGNVILFVFQVSPADSGFYSCVAGNILGESVSSAHLAISPAPGLRCLPLLVMASLCLVLASHSLSEPGLTRRQLRTSGL